MLISAMQNHGSLCKKRLLTTNAIGQFVSTYVSLEQHVFTLLIEVISIMLRVDEINIVVSTLHCKFINEKLINVAFVCAAF